MANNSVTKYITFHSKHNRQLEHFFYSNGPETQTKFLVIKYHDFTLSLSAKVQVEAGEKERERSRE